MPAEDLAAYQSHLKSFTDEYNPKGAAEAMLVQALADASWRLNRVVASRSEPTWTPCWTPWNSINQKEKSTTPPTMASFLQNPKSPKPSAAAPTPNPVRKP